jgi:hypothetical protein
MVLSAVAGFLVIGLGYLAARDEAMLDKQIKEQIRQGIEEALQQGREAIEVTRGVADARGVRVPTPQSASAGSVALQGASEFVKSLAELARSLTGVRTSVASYLIATIFFLFVLILASINQVS